MKKATEIQADALPAPEKEAFETKHYNLLLLTVQTQIHGASHDKATLDKALAELDQAVVLGQPSRSVFLLKEKCYEFLRHPDQAEKQAELASQAPENALSHFLEGEWLRVEANALKSVDSDGTDWKPNAKKLEEAIDQYKKALRQEPKNFWCFFQMGRCYLGLGRAADALEALTTCVALRPEAPWPYSVRGLIYALRRAI